MDEMLGRQGFPAAFGFSDTLRVPASDALHAAMRRLQRLPVRPPRRLEDIPASRLAFDAAVTAALHAQSADGADAMQVSSCRVEHFDGVPVLCIVPPGELRGAVIHVHGGGWCLGDSRPLQPALARLAQVTSTLVASIDYRLAPEHRHPSALDDCVRAAQALVERFRNKHGFDARRVVLAGESAGAHLALMALPRLRDAGLRFAGASLTYGLYDLSNTLPSRRGKVEAPLLDADACRFYVEAYLGEGARVDASSSPWAWSTHAFEDMPPALFCAGTADPLHDDSVGMHARWLAAGNDAWRVDYEGAPHAFDLLPVPESKHLADMRADFVRYCLADFAKPR